jgi:hypothetical protein
MVCFFVKKNKSGFISIQIIDKSCGKYKLVKTIGSSADDLIIDKLMEQAQYYILHYGGQTTLDFILGDDQKYFQYIYENIQQVQLPK